jgi:hypothetical protein
VTHKEGVGADCSPILKFVFMAIPFLTLIVGAIFLGVAFSYWNAILVEVPARLTTVKNNIWNYQGSIQDTLNQMPVGIPFNKQLIDNGIKDTDTNMNDFIGVLKSIDITRHVLIWIAVSSAILSAILSCIFVQFNKGALFEDICLCFFLIFFAVCLLIPFANVLSFTAVDCCNELNYQNGVLYLWPDRYRINIDYLEKTAVINSINDNGNTGCNYIDQLCKMGNIDMCDNCTPNNITEFENKTLTDTGPNTVTLAYCASSCTDQNLLNISYNAMQRLNDTNYWISLNPLLEYPLGLLDDADLRTYLKDRVCDISTSVGLTYTGCGILLGGLVISLILCLILRGQGEGNQKKNEQT